jgi:hypothetical protein
VLEEQVQDPNGLPNPPTTWFWNIRVGDKVQIRGTGPWYTVCGPIVQDNQEGFVNVGPPGALSPLGHDYLLLTNGRDDNRNGWADEGWDGVDNNANGTIDELAEWEPETWLSPPGSQLTYTIRRRLAPTVNARETVLPSNVVIDLTTWDTDRERSRLPVQAGGLPMDLVINPDGSVLPSSRYGVPTAVGMDGAFCHFWLAERGDVYSPAVNTMTTATPPGPPYLPINQGMKPDLFPGNGELKGEKRLVTLYTRSGKLDTTENPPFDDRPFRKINPVPISQYDLSKPFEEAQQR